LGKKPAVGSHSLPAGFLRIRPRPLFLELNHRGFQVIQGHSLEATLGKETRSCSLSAPGGLLASGATPKGVAGISHFFSWNQPFGLAVFRTQGRSLENYP
jgi:hypothetical protein